MIKVTNRIPVAEGFETDFEERFRTRAHLVDTHKGFISNRVLRPVTRRWSHRDGSWSETDNPQFFVIETYWESEEDFWAWTKSEDFRTAHANRPPEGMFDGPNVLEIHEVAFESLGSD